MSSLRDNRPSSINNTSASDLLQDILSEVKGTLPAVKQVSVNEARQKPIVNTDSSRRFTRVLFITTDTQILTQATTSLDGFTSISDVFDEVYVMVLRTGIPARHPVLRVAAQTWLYTVTAKHSWQLPFAAWKMMSEQLSFAGGFRPDLIIARDPLVSAFVAYGASLIYTRPSQLHLVDNHQQNVTTFDNLLANFLIRRFFSIRTMTIDRSVQLQKQNPHLDVSVLPQYRDYLGKFTGEQGDYLKNRYRQFNFIILYIGSLHHTSAAFSAIDAVRDVLKNPRIGFVIIGDGVGVAECLRRAELLGLQEQVIIERRADDINSYLSSADILLIPDKDKDADEVVLYGAAAGIPMVMSETSLRSDLFKHNENAIIVNDRNIKRMSEGLSLLLNNSTKRLSFRLAVRKIAEERLHSDIKKFERAFRDSLEEAIIAYDNL